MTVGERRIQGVPAEYADRTSEDGKTSSVHWVRFPFARDDIEAFREPDAQVVIGISHPSYGHMAVVPPEMRAELAKDFD
jgi:hypothetical protein